MAFPSSSTRTCSITVNLFDGSRQHIPPATKALFTFIDGNQSIRRESAQASSFRLDGLPYFNNFGDSYAVIASASGFEQAGFHPVKVAPNAPQQVDLMLLAKNATFNFSGARWETLPQVRPSLARVLAAGAASPAAAKDRYLDLLEKRGPALACLLNITTAMDHIHLSSGTPMDYIKQLIWDDSMKQDRFFAFADSKLLDQVKLAAQQGVFSPEPGSAIFHPGATSSFKQVQFGEANVQLTFHDNERCTIDGVECVKIEPDIDYFKDIGAHALIEVAFNSLTGALTDPRQVYVLRWTAGRRAGVAAFDPLYTIV